MNTDAYQQGFMDKCAKYGVDPATLVNPAGRVRRMADAIKLYFGNVSGKRLAKLTDEYAGQAKPLHTLTDRWRSHKALPKEFRRIGVPIPRAEAVDTGNKSHRFAARMLEEAMNDRDSARFLSRIGVGVGGTVGARQAWKHRDKWLDK